MFFIYGRVTVLVGWSLLFISLAQSNWLLEKTIVLLLWSNCFKVCTFYDLSVPVCEEERPLNWNVRDLELYWVKVWACRYWLEYVFFLDIVYPRWSLSLFTTKMLRESNRCCLHSPWHWKIKCLNRKFGYSSLYGHKKKTSFTYLSRREDCRGAAYRHFLP